MVSATHRHTAVDDHRIGGGILDGRTYDIVGSVQAARGLDVLRSTGKIPGSWPDRRKSGKTKYFMALKALLHFIVSLPGLMQEFEPNSFRRGEQKIIRIQGTS